MKPPGRRGPSPQEVEDIRARIAYSELPLTKRLVTRPPHGWKRAGRWTDLRKDKDR